jgi:hypothetical protein
MLSDLKIVDLAVLSAALEDPDSQVRKAVWMNPAAIKSGAQ